MQFAPGVFAFLFLGAAPFVYKGAGVASAFDVAVALSSTDVPVCALPTYLSLSKVPTMI